MLEPVTVPCQECGRELAPTARASASRLTDDDELLTYCAECSQQEFGESCSAPELL